MVLLAMCGGKRRTTQIDIPEDSLMRIMTNEPIQMSESKDTQDSTPGNKRAGEDAVKSGTTKARKLDS